MISGNAPGRHSSEAFDPSRVTGRPYGFGQSVGSNDELRDNDVVDFPVQLLTGKEGEAQRAAAKVFEAPYPGYENVRHNDRFYHFDSHSVLSAPVAHSGQIRTADAMSADCQVGFSTRQGKSAVNRSMKRNGGTLHWGWEAFGLLMIHTAIAIFLVAAVELFGDAIPAVWVLS